MTKHKYDLHYFRELAQSKKGRCISLSFVSMKHKLAFICCDGHQWNANPKDLIYSNSWCPKCAHKNKKKKFTIKDCKKIAKLKSGKCLSEKYVNCSSPLQWECSSGHKWSAPLSRIKNEKRWCPECAGCKKHTIEEAKKLAEARQGKCLSNTYINSHEYLLWECKKGHQWKAKFYLVKNLNNWCRKCSGSSKKTMLEMKKFAEKKRGSCLSKTYKDNKTKLLWECAKGHQWKAHYNSLSASKSWCPQCKLWKTQKLLYDTICGLYGKENCFFNYRKFDWLKMSDTGYKMEIDIFINDAQGKKVAIEYHGEQHFRPIKYFGGKQSFKRIQKRDKLKAKLLSDSKEIDCFIVFKSGMPVDNEEFVESVVSAAILNSLGNKNILK